MEYDNTAIDSHRAGNLARFKEEVSHNGPYEKWYEELEDYRKYLRNKYIEHRFRDWYCIGRKLIPSGDILDHHVGAYLAPLEFTRTGWNGERLCPSKQIILLDRYFKSKGIRFVYVALPCKGFVHTDLMGGEEYQAEKSITVPQWRKMLKEIVEEGVETVDCLPPFTGNKGKGLYSKEHNLSPAGCDFTAALVADYLQKTISKGLESEPGRFTKAERLYSIHSTMQGKGAVDEFEVQLYKGWQVTDTATGKPYTGFLNDSGIAIFGNCNLQSYMYDGGGITSCLSAYLNYPISYLGRRLPFCAKPKERIDGSALELLCRKEILLYVGFPSAAFVRSSVSESLLSKIKGMALTRQIGLYKTWSTADLKI